MKLIEPSYSILEQKPDIDGIYEQIELAARTCYKSIRPEGKTAKDFVDRLIKNKHWAMLENGTVYLLFSECCYDNSDLKFIDKYTRNPYSKVVHMGSDDDLVEETSDKIIYTGDIWGTGVSGNTVYAITTNYRTLVENKWLDDLQYLCEPTEYHEKRITVKFITSIGIVRELLRHRKFSFANESSRYCSYNLNKFNNELTFIIPSWFNKENTNFENSYSYKKLKYYPEFDYNYIEGCGGKVSKEDMFIHSLLTAEKAYLEMINLGAVAQEAREVLPLATKSELIMTGFVSDWKYLFDLRVKGTTGMPHPDIKALCEPLMKEFITKKYISNEKI